MTLTVGSLFSGIGGWGSLGTDTNSMPITCDQAGCDEAATNITQTCGLFTPPKVWCSCSRHIAVVPRDSDPTPT